MKRLWSEDPASLLEELCRQPGTNGVSQAGQYVAEQLKKVADEVCVDVLGSVYGIRRCGKPEAPLMVLEAHIDEIGFVVTGVDDGGFLRVDKIGGVDLRTLPAAKVTVLAEEPLSGVFCSVPPHLAGDKDPLPALTDCRIDVGLTAEEARKRVPIGTRVCFAEHFEKLQGGRVTAKALDDRAGVAAVLLAMEKLCSVPLTCDVAAVFNVLEETGEQGAAVSAQRLQPTQAIVVDVSFADMPGTDPVACGKMGGGPMIGFSPCLDAAMSRRLIELAKQNGMPFQTEVMGGRTGTDVDRMGTAGEGVRMGLVSIPLRNMHTPIEMLQVSDVEAVGELLAAYVREEWA